MPSNLLLLDEPTNHLDIPAREAIESFMHESPATLLVVSHDRRLLETVCTTLWVVDDGLAVPFDGGWKEWRAAVADGWTVHAAAEREAQRLRGGAHGGHGSRRRRIRGGGGRRGGPCGDAPGCDRGRAATARSRERPGGPAAAGAATGRARPDRGAAREAVEGRLPPPEGDASTPS